MTKFFRKTSLALTVAALALTATPALAASPTQNATGKVRILRPLTIAWVQDLDLGTIVLGTGSATIGISRAGAFSASCGPHTCSGTTTEARYKLTGTNNQNVTINAAAVTLSGPGSLTLSLDAPTTVNLSSSGTVGTEFGIGGYITVSNTTPDGLYSGNFAVTAEYQ